MRDDARARDGPLAGQGQRNDARDSADSASVSELQARVDGVGAMPQRLDAVDGAVREPTWFRDGVVPAQDEDGSGELEFGEFCALLAKVKRGDVGNLHGFAKLTEDIKATPVSVLNIEVLKRGLKSKYRFVETREATAMYDKYEVMEVTLSGHWYEIVKGQ